MASGWDLKVPPGVVPKNFPIYVALGFASVVIVAMVFTGSGTPAPEGPDADVAAALDAAVADVESVVAPVIRQGERLSEDLARLEAQREEEAAALAAAAAREQEATMRDARRELESARAALLDAQRMRDEAARTGLPVEEVESDIRETLQTVEERDLREALRLQEVERMVVSLRSPAVVADSGVVSPPQRAASPPAPVITGDPAVDRQLLDMMRQEMDGADAPAPAARRRGPEVFAPAGGAGAPPPADEAPGVSLTEFYTPGPDLEVGESSGRGTVAVARWADVPEGMDLVYEGRMMQAVLETQLSGDFTGPARARLTLPVRTADRTRVVIPRGAVALGQALAVENGFQARLAVTFNRLRFGDGRSVRLGFEGLSALGETGLTDEVNRHYMSTLGAVGAVGLLAGLSAGGGAGQGYFDPARQQFSVAAIRFLDRFMNRLPEVTGRAGHPVRSYLTQDLLVPRGGTR